MSKLTNMLRFIAAGMAAYVPVAIASDASLSSLPGNNTSFATAADYVANWSSLEIANPVPPPGYGNAHINTWDYPVQGNVDNHELIAGGSSTDLAFHYHVDFWVDPSEAGPFDFRIAPDFGLGGAAFLDGAEVGFNPNDMWWNWDWNNSSQQFIFSGGLAVGHHTLDLYGQEACCDGATGAEFAINGGAWTSFGDRDGLNANAVPETTGLEVFIPAGLCLVAYGFRRRNNAA